MTQFRPGADTATGGLDPNELWLPIFSGQTYLAFGDTTIFAGLVDKPSLVQGNEFIFNYFGKATSETHQAGAEIVGSTIPQTQRSIYLDERPIFTSAEFDDVDARFAQWEYRGNVASEHGRELARQLDSRTAGLIINSARTTRPGGLSDFNGGGTDQNGADYVLTGYDTNAGTDDYISNALLVLKSIDSYNLTMDEIDAPDSEATYCVIEPAVWHAMRNIAGVAYTAGTFAAGRPINQFENPMSMGPNPNLYAGAKKTDTLTWKGVTIFRSNRIPMADYSAVWPTNTYGGNFADTRGMIWRPSAVGLAMVSGVKTESGRHMTRQADQVISSMHLGGGGLRVETAWELTSD